MGDHLDFQMESLMVVATVLMRVLKMVLRLELQLDDLMELMMALVMALVMELSMGNQSDVYSVLGWGNLMVIPMDFY